jgi:hypothetical protein
LRVEYSEQGTTRSGGGLDKKGEFRRYKNSWLGGFLEIESVLMDELRIASKVAMNSILQNKSDQFWKF